MIVDVLHVFCRTLILVQRAWGKLKRLPKIMEHPKQKVAKHGKAHP